MKILLTGTAAAPLAAIEESLAAEAVLRLAAKSALAQAVIADLPDAVVVVGAAPDELGNIARRAPVIVLTASDDPAAMERAITAGVSAYHVVGATLPALMPLIRAAIALFGRERQLETELRHAKAALAERRSIDEAKVLLMRRDKMSEPDAHLWLRRRAMNTGRRLGDVADELLRGQRK